jgi:uncharacterized membrane protein YbhN (UPF0104 family)
MDSELASQMENRAGAPRAARGRWRTLVAALLQVACVGFVAATIWTRMAELKAAFHLGLPALLSLIALMAIAHAQRAAELTYLLRRLAVRESFGEGFLLSGASFLLNHLPLNPGVLVRALVLRREHELPYTAFLSLTMLNALINVAVAAACALVLLLASGLQQVSTAWGVVAVLGGVVVMAVLVIWVPMPTTSETGGILSRQLRAAVGALAAMRGSGLSIVVLALLALSKIAALGVRMSICFAAVGATVPASVCLLLAATTIALSVVNITPGNLGLREMVLAAVSAQLGSSHVLAMAAASVDRVVSLAYAVVAGLPGLYALKRKGSIWRG